MSLKTEGSLRVMLIGLAAAAPACSLLYSADLGDARSFPDVTASREGGAPRSEASTDAPSSGSDAGLVRGCANLPVAPRFCADFDGEGDPLAGFQISREPGEDEQVVETKADLFFSAPRSLRTRMQAAPDGAYTRAERIFPNIGESQLEVRVKLRPSSPWKATTVLAITLDSDSNTFCQALFYVDESTARDGTIGAMRVNVQSPPGITNDLRPLRGFPRVDEWTELGLFAVPAANGGVRVTYEVLGSDGTRQTTTEEYAQCRLRRELHLGFGFHFEGGSAEVRYDDIIVDWR